MQHVLVIHGPNLSMLGAREPQIYGYETLAMVESRLRQCAHEYSLELIFFQSHNESALIDQIHQAKGNGVKAIIINPAALTHTSIALRDALLSAAIPFIEVHLSNIYARESFRRTSYFSDIAEGVISGFGAQSYDLALYALILKIKKLS